MVKNPKPCPKTLPKPNGCEEEQNIHNMIVLKKKNKELKNNYNNKSLFGKRWCMKNYEHDNNPRVLIKKIGCQKNITTPQS